MKAGMGGVVTSLNVFDLCYTSQSLCTGQNDSFLPKEKNNYIRISSYTADSIPKAGILKRKL